MRKLFILLIMTVFLMVGCTICNEVWIKPGLTQEQLQYDNRLCRKYAQQIRWSIAYGGGAGAPYRDRMQSKGYYLVDKETDERSE